MQGNEFVQSPQAFHTVGNACSCETFAGLVEQTDIVVILGPSRCPDRPLLPSM
jgi:hypothetical protein